MDKVKISEMDVQQASKLKTRRHIFLFTRLNIILSKKRIMVIVNFFLCQNIFIYFSKLSDNNIVYVTREIFLEKVREVKNWRIFMESDFKY